MGDVAAVHAAQLAQFRRNARMFAAVAGAGFGHLLQQGQAGIGLVRGAAGHALRGQVCQFLRGGHGGGAGLAHIGQVQHTAGLQVAFQQLAQGGAVAGADPGVHPVADDEITGGQCGIGRVQRGLKALAHEAHIGHAHRLCQGLCLGDGIRIEVQSDELPLRVGGGRNDRADARAAAQFQPGVGLLQIRCAAPQCLQGAAQPDGHELAVEVVGVGHVGDVAIQVRGRGCHGAAGGRNNAKACSQGCRLDGVTAAGARVGRSTRPAVCDQRRKCPCRVQRRGCTGHRGARLRSGRSATRSRHGPVRCRWRRLRRSCWTRGTGACPPGW